MSVHSLHTSHPSPDWQKLEAELLSELKLAEAAFKGAGSGQREAAERKFREALRRFSELVLDRNAPPGLNGQP